MLIHKRVLYLVCSFIAISILVSVAVLNWERIGRANFQCLRFQDRYPKSTCGLYVPGSNSRISRVIGYVTKKSIVNKRYFFNLKSINSNGKEINFTVEIAPDPILKYIITLTPKNQFKPGMEIDPSKQLATKEFYEQLQINEQIMVDMLTPDEQQLTLARKKYGNLHLFSCAKYQAQFIEYLRQSDFFSHLQVYVLGFTSQCNLSTISIEKM